MHIKISRGSLKEMDSKLRTQVMLRPSLFKYVANAKMKSPKPAVFIKDCTKNKCSYTNIAHVLFSKSICHPRMISQWRHYLVTPGEFKVVNHSS